MVLVLVLMPVLTLALLFVMVGAIVGLEVAAPYLQVIVALLVLANCSSHVIQPRLPTGVQPRSTQ
jgi:hypothetical protein